MKTIDAHAHIVPSGLFERAGAGEDWHGYRLEPGKGHGTAVRGERRTPLLSPKLRLTPEERLADMDAQGVDCQVLSVHPPFFGYDLDVDTGRRLAREINDEIAALTKAHPTRFGGLATLPMQDVGAAIAELERAVSTLGLKGCELDTAVNGANWDEPEFLPFFKAAEALGAVLFFHPQPLHNFLRERTTRYGLVNSLGVILDDAIVTAILIYSGILETCPDLKILIAHGGGPACYAMGRLDRGWHRSTEFHQTLPSPPSSYQKRLYYDTVVGSEAALRFLIDQVGADRVVLGSDWPFVPWAPVGWVEGLDSLTAAEKDQILHQTARSLFGLDG